VEDLKVMWFPMLQSQFMKVKQKNTNEKCDETNLKIKGVISENMGDRGCGRTGGET